MNAGRRRFVERLAAAGVGERVQLVFPAVPGDASGEGVMVHAKVMIVDDRLLRIGPAPLHHRSLGAHSECDLALEATPADATAPITRLLTPLLPHPPRPATAE